MEPDLITYSSLITACERAGEAGIAYHNAASTAQHSRPLPHPLPWFALAPANGLELQLPTKMQQSGNRSAQCRGSD